LQNDKIAAYSLTALYKNKAFAVVFKSGETPKMLKLSILKNPI